MPLDLPTTFLLIGAGFFAGTLNAIAGGGSLVSLPLLIFVGLPATVANATNRIALFIGGIGATQSFAKRDLIPAPWFKFALPPALVGVVFGTWGATRIGDVAFERVLAVVLLLAAGLILWKPLRILEEAEVPTPPTGAKRWWLIVAFFGLGIYSGFIQAGVGFLFVALFAAQGIDLIRANGIKAPLILMFTGLAIALFAFTGLLDWAAGLTLAGGQFFGAKFGVRLQVLKGQRWVRSVLILAIVAFSIRLLLGG
ncbi:MAG: sulfite exporter TauE/SafE family protein [Gemmatimonadota bacterium]|nr:sulfite exporter TauE/SafE family protein [Gemmatimonadota bacterium]